MAKPTSKDQLKDYIKRKLGAPVLEINVDDDQLDDRVDEHYSTSTLIIMTILSKYT